MLVLKMIEILVCQMMVQSMQTQLNVQMKMCVIVREEVGVRVGVGGRVVLREKALANVS